MFFTEKKIKNIVNDLKKYVHTSMESINSYEMKEGNFKSPIEAEKDPTLWKNFGAGERWGGRDQRYWFRTTVEIPKEFGGKPVVFVIKTGREGQWDATNPQFLIFVNKKIKQGLDVNHREVLLTQKAKEGEKYTIDLHAYAGMNEGQVELQSYIAILNKEVEQLVYDVIVPLETIELLQEEDKNRIDMLHYLNEGINLLDLRQPLSESFYQSIREAREYLQKNLYEGLGDKDDIIARCVGHTHIDVAWLWTLDQTREKVVRSFSTVLNLMKEYPEYIFMSSQPQLYKFLKQEQPELYEEVKQQVQEGRWEPEGAMWLEADCNLTSGESLIRQILFGTKFFEEEFGVQNKILWLPDVFGYSAALPQILKSFGIDYFMTTKIGWNEYNKMPYDTFNWRGIDGTEILTHFITTSDYKKGLDSTHSTTYNGKVNASQVKGAWQRYQQKDINDEVLICYGYGDGGGGPTRDMLEQGRRLAKGIPGCPKVEQSKALDFFTRLEEKVGNNPKLPKWVGELYLEYHRGTYTTMARNKKYNRKSEFLYQDVELFHSMSRALTDEGSYPQDKINEGWEMILLNQFHDIIPGSSIKEVYEESKKQYEKVIRDGKDILHQAIDQVARKIDLKETSLIVFNQLGFTRSDIVEFTIPEGYKGIQILDEQGGTIPVQRIEENKAIFFASQIAPKGYKVFTIKEVAEESNQSEVHYSKDSFSTLDNKYFHVVMNQDGTITSIYDKKNNREVLKEGTKANVLQAFEDKPLNYDAWDINIYYQEKMWEVTEMDSIELIEKGPVRTTVKISRTFLDSTIIQYMHLYEEIPRIDFENKIDWKEKQILLKAAFPVDIHTDKATYEIQYGNVERPTHWNTSWDMAKFEVCAHKWADLSEDNYGVSLLNDCKYGHDIKDGVMRLSLIKSPVSPNEDADREVHEFTYSLYPHSGGWKQGRTVQMAYQLNCPMYSKIEDAHKGTLSRDFSIIEVDQENVMIEVVKKAEDSEDMIVRLYECYNRRTDATIHFCKQFREVWECDLREQELHKVSDNTDSFTIRIKPYEIKTYMIKL